MAGPCTVPRERRATVRARFPTAASRSRSSPRLELGSVALPVLQRRIDPFMVEGGRGPYPDME